MIFIISLLIPSPVYEEFLEGIKEIEYKLLNENLSPYERVRLKDEVKKYTVAVHPYDVKNYERARQKGQSISYNNVLLSKYKNDYIKVIECQYDKVGYKRMEYDKAAASSVIW